MSQLDSDLLRSFIAIVDAGSITRGAARIGRTQSAVSLQVQRLEATLGTPVFERHGRGVVLTNTGEKLEPVARRTISMLDRSLAEIRTENLTGAIRIGIPDDHGKSLLTKIVSDFSAQHPAVELTVRCELSAGFSRAIADGDLDVAVYEAPSAATGTEILREEKTFWVSSRDHAAHLRDPLPVALFDRDCWWRDVSLEALRASGRDYRIVYSSESVTGVTAAIEAGIAVGLLGSSSISRGLQVLTEPAVFARMPVSRLILERRPGPDDPIVSAMADAIRRALRLPPLAILR